MNYTELFGAISGILYVLLEIKQNKFMWIVGGVSALVYVVIFAHASLFASAGLQTWYVGASLYGWIVWSRESKQRGSYEPIVVVPGRRIIFYSSMAALSGTFVLWYLLKYYSDDPMPMADALIASMSMLATYWVAKKYIHHWFLWIVADMFAVVIYAISGLYPTAVLYFVYGVAAIAGLYAWRKFPKVLEKP